MSSQQAQASLAWKDNLYGELIRLAWPITVSMLSYSVMTVVDTLFVSRLGASALAGVGLGGMAAFTVLGFGWGGLRSVKVLVSQAVGAGDRQEVPAVLGSGLVVAMGMGIVSIGLGLVLARVLPDFTATARAGQLTGEYLTIRSLSAPLVLVGVALREGRYGQGDARSPMTAALVANLAHIPVNALFIFGLNWGVSGAAWATLLCHALETALLARVQLRSGLGLAAVRRRHLVDVWQMGWPLGLQFVLEIGAFATLVLLLSRISEVDLAAHQIVVQFIHASFLPAFAVGEAASVLVGQAVGANRDALVKPVARGALWIVALYTGGCGLLLALGARLFVGFFTADEAVAEVAIRLCYVAALFQVFDGASIVARGVLRATGDVRFPALISVGIAWLCTPPLTVLLGIGLGLGAVGGWLGLSIEIVLGASILWWRFERGAWHKWAQRSRDRLSNQAGGRAALT